MGVLTILKSLERDLIYILIMLSLTMCFYHVLA